ncbi:hypothetical protein ACVW2L_004135 [Mucilaginibacter sp. HD30]
MIGNFRHSLILAEAQSEVRGETKRELVLLFYESVNKLVISKQNHLRCVNRATKYRKIGVLKEYSALNTHYWYTEDYLVKLIPCLSNINNLARVLNT